MVESMTVIYVADEHHRLHWLWKEQRISGLHLCHVDFHCDMRGLLIDRPGQRAWLYDPKELQKVDQGNFLTHAVLDGTVAGVRWFHDRHGGRRYDQGTVRYESDLRVRLRAPPSGEPRPFVFSERSLAEWRGPAEGEHLDLDWDGLACSVYAQAQSDRLKAQFLSVPFHHRPDVVYFIYSYCSSILDDDAFEGFLAALARKLEARVERLSPLPPELSNLESPGVHRERRRTRLLKPLKRPQQWLVSQLKRLESGDDLAFPYPG